MSELPERGSLIHSFSHSLLILSYVESKDPLSVQPFSLLTPLKLTALLCIVFHCIVLCWIGLDWMHLSESLLVKLTAKIELSVGLT